MADEDLTHWFDDVEIIIRDPDKFKSKLVIGEDAYTTLRLKRRLGEFWNIASTATIAGGVAQSSAVASTFFAPAWFLSALGVTAVTPIGWVVAAAVLSGGACYGVTHYLRDVSKDKVIKIPKFINTPIDVLALGLFDLMAPLALKVADADGHIDETEMQCIHAYLTHEWGYDETFIVKGLEFTESKLSEFSIEEQARTLAEFKKANRDCNYDAMSAELMSFLTAIMEADGREDKREKEAIESVQKTFKDVSQSWFGKLQKSASAAIVATSETIKATSEQVGDKFAKHAEEAAKIAQESYEKASAELKSGSEKAQEVLNDLLKGTGEKGITQKEPIEDTIALRLDQATPAELDRLRTFLGLKQTANVEEIVDAYRSAAGNSFINMARQFDLAGKITYREILIDVFEKIRPVGDDVNAWTDKVASIFKKPCADVLAEKQKEPSIDDLETALIEMAKSKINNAVEGMSAEEKEKWRKKAEEEMTGSAGHVDFSWSGFTAFAGSSATAMPMLFSFVPIGKAGAQATKILSGMRAGALFIPAATTAAVVSAILIPIALSTPAYRKTVNATLELILIGRRQSAELEMEMDKW